MIDFILRASPLVKENNLTIDDCNSSAYPFTPDIVDVLYKYLTADTIDRVPDDVDKYIQYVLFYLLPVQPLYELYAFIHTHSLRQTLLHHNIMIDDINHVFTVEGACKHGYTRILKYFYRASGSFLFDTGANIVAATHGQLSCLQFLFYIKCPWDARATEAAAAEGHLACLMYLHENGCPWDNWTARAAASNGHLDCLKYLHENGCPWHH